MIKSMTAFGRGEVETEGQKWVVELRTLNHRFLELSLNLPKRLWALEDRVRKLVRGRISRGRVEMQLLWESLGDRGLTLRLDQGLLDEARLILQSLMHAADVQEPLRLEHFLPFADVIVAREREAQDLEETWKLVSQVVTQALEALEVMRVQEGAALAEDLGEHLETVRRELERIQAQAPLLPQMWREKVATRLAELFPEGAPIDETRLAQELAFLADRRDISEELARMASHVGQFGETLTADGPVGRKQEFLLQEMLREVNTMGSKAQDLTISQAVLEIKGALERLREQVQNIE